MFMQPWEQLAAAVIVCLVAGVVQAAGDPAPLELRGAVAIDVADPSTAVAAAAGDLARDFGWVLGTPAKLRHDPPAAITIGIDPAVGRAEAYCIRVTRDGVTVTGADELGAVYGIYRFSRDALGVDPYWFFKDARPPRRTAIRLQPREIRSTPPTFRFRGWFVNDEDLLTEWKDGGGVRHIDYPFYSQVVRLDVLERVFETLLRAEGNLIIPASFVDVMNEPEARLVARAAQRGLYVSQHHIEPLGVSHFGYENYWKARGHARAFAYGSHPEWVRQAWRDYAARWIELAGDRVVWQLGLRGKGDRAIWRSDASVDEAAAGRFISQAIAEQWEIVRAVDPRPNPPATTTLWAEGSRLMLAGKLTFPKGVTVVFADEGSSQTMQADFRQAARQPQRTYGVYYHVGFWNRFAPAVLHPSYRAMLSNLIELEGDALLQDGTAMVAAGQLLRQIASGKGRLADASRPKGIHDDRGYVEVLSQAIDGLDDVAAGHPADRLSPAQRRFFDVHLLTQTRMLREVYAYLRALLQATSDPDHLVDAEAALQRLLDARAAAERGKWAGWYRGDKKVNVPRWLAETRSLREKKFGAGQQGSLE